MTARKPRKPRTCECGGRLKYVESFGLTFCWCEKCTPFVDVYVPRKKGGRA